MLRLLRLVAIVAIFASPAFAQKLWEPQMAGELPPANPIPREAQYIVARNDTLIDISQKFINLYRYPFIVEEWVAINPGLTPEMIMPGDILRVPNLRRVRRVKNLLANPRTSWDNAEIVVNINAKSLLIANRDTGETIHYAIGIGKPETPTPLGKFVIYEILDSPVFRRSNGTVVWTSRLKQGQLLPMNWAPLISLGLRMNKSGAIRYRIHSTTDPHTVGDALGGGCIRMHIDDALELRQLIPNPATTGIETPGRIER